MTPLHCCVLERVLESQVIRIGPTRPPQMDPPPPISIMMMGRMAALNANADGVMAASVKAYSAPAMAQKMALATKATSFQLAVRTPRVSAAISLVAMARRARPRRMPSARSVKSRMSRATIQTR